MKNVDKPRGPADKDNDIGPDHGPLGDAISDRGKPDPRTRGGKPPTPVEDRPTVGTVTPEDYPLKDRTRGR